MPTRLSSEDRSPKAAAPLSRVVSLVQRQQAEPGMLTDAETHASVEQLKNTIVAMRQQMEQAQLDQQRLAQEALAAANDEIAQLKRTIVAMRDALEQKEGGRKT